MLSFFRSSFHIYARNLKRILMSQNLHIDLSPPTYSGPRNFLDKDAFKKSVPILAARVPVAKIGSLLKSEVIKRFILVAPKVHTVISDPSGSVDERLVLLNVSNAADISPELDELVQSHTNGLTEFTVQLDYNNWSVDDILRVILPEELREGSPSGYALTGHIAHINLNEEYLPYKHIIGQLILDKNKGIKTVVNKVGNIENKFRFFKMEVLAGEPNFVSESGCRFTFDFSQVYWNSRLGTEHDRLVQLFTPEDVVVDVFAGVGPFAIPAAKKGCAVLANDLNPNSAKYLSINVNDNRVEDFVRVSCEDGRDFIRSVVSRVYDVPFPTYTGPKPSRTQEEKSRRQALKLAAQGRLMRPHPHNDSARRCISQFVMNLPDSAILFLDAFRGILSDKAWNLSGCYDIMPMIHCYCFTRELEQDKAAIDIRKRVQEKLGGLITEDVHLHHVRSVAPGKEMYCISFRLPREVAFDA